MTRDPLPAVRSKPTIRPILLHHHLGINMTQFAARLVRMRRSSQSDAERLRQNPRGSRDCAAGALPGNCRALLALVSVVISRKFPRILLAKEK